MQAMYAICRFHVAVCTAERTPLPTFLPFHRDETTPPPSPTKFGSPSHQSWISLEKSNFDAKEVAVWYAPRQKGSERFQPHSRTPFDRHEKSGATRFGWHRSASLSVYSPTLYSGALDRSRAFYRWPSAQSQKATRRPQARQASQARRCNRTTRTPPQASSCHPPQP